MKLDMRWLWLSLVISLHMLDSAEAHAAAAIEWVEVGGAGNACDPLPGAASFPSGCYGAVANLYRIGKFDVTNAQFAEFLNAIAATDTHALYSGWMSSSGDPGFGGILRHGAPDSYFYETIAGRDEMPVNWVSFWGAVRFANWLHNGMPSGLQDATTTEDGAYSLTPGSAVFTNAMRGEKQRDCYG